ncbi:MAG: ATP-binding cassette domain-containing protein [Gammaproteobacteria bacterium]|nr:ATP-binding cassette domain-containing protein [Gammaproteobacteria bacterium]
MDLIEANKLAVQLDHKTILHSFSFSIAEGEFVGVLGPNGAGKSTLLKLILGLLQPSMGTLSVLGATPHRGHAQIGYLPQHRLVSSGFNLTGYQLLASSLRAHRYGLPLLSSEDKTKIESVLHAVGAQAIARQSFLNLSGGERQRLLLAQALLGDPKILLLDEPLNNLDPHYQEVLIDLVAQVAKQKKITVLFTAHDVNALLPVMDRVLYIVKGVAKLGLVQEVITSDHLSSLYGTPIEVLNYKGRVFVLGQHRGLGDFHHHCHE